MLVVSSWLWVVGGLATGLVLLVAFIVAAAGGFLWLLSNTDKFDYTGALSHGEVVQVPIQYQPWDKPFERTGDEDLPFAIRLKGKVYRWHSRERVFQGDDFYKTFEDGPWKWEAQGRFAGRDINCGHYFGLSPEAATDEAKYYGVSEATAVLLELEGETSRVLDLTHPSVIRAFFERCVDNHSVVSWSYFTMLEELIERVKGGSAITDYFGYAAKHQRYEGILFFSSRAMDVVEMRALNRNLEGISFGPKFHELRTNPRLLNIVLFSGATVMQRTSTYRIGDSAVFVNSLFKRPIDEIWPVFQYDEQFQFERERFSLGKPSYIPT